MPDVKPFRKLYVNKASRAELAAWDPTDISDPDLFPQLGHDVPYKIGPDGYPVMALDTRVEARGETGFWHVTTCSSCRKDLYYKMCGDCERALRMGLGMRLSVEQRLETGMTFEPLCTCRRESFYLYLRCEDHKRFEDPALALGSRTPPPKPNMHRRRRSPLNRGQELRSCPATSSSPT